MQERDGYQGKWLRVPSPTVYAMQPFEERQRLYRELRRLQAAWAEEELAVMEARRRAQQAVGNE